MFWILKEVFGEAAGDLISDFAALTVLSSVLFFRMDFLVQLLFCPVIPHFFFFFMTFPI